jgi:hypothetical protein
MKSLRWHDRHFNQAIQEYGAATNKDMADVLNRALRNVGFKTAKNTPKESAGDIEAEMRKDKKALKIATKQLRGRIGKTYTTKKGSIRTFKRVTRKQIGRKAKQLITKRQKRRGFLRAGWIAAMIAAGVKGVRKGSDFIKSSGSALGSGHQAKPGKLSARLGNRVWGRLEGKAKGTTAAKMKAALTKGMQETRTDMIHYARGRMAQTAAKHSAGKRGG